MPEGRYMKLHFILQLIHIMINSRRRLSTLVETEGQYVRVDHGKVEGGQEHVGVGKSNEHGTVDNGGTATVDLTSGLVSVTRVVGGLDERSVGQVELGNPGNELRLTSDGVDRGGVAVVGADSKTGSIPGEVDLLAGEGKRLRAVAGDGRATAVTGDVQVLAALLLGDSGDAGVGSAVTGDLVVGGIVGRPAVDVGLVDDVEGGEVLPCETGGVGRARRDVGSEERPGPRLRNTGLEPDGHGEETAHLAESHLLTSLGGNGLSEELTNLTAVKVVDETPNTRLTVAGKLLVEVEELTDSGVRVVVGALRGSGVTEHVG